ncbi:MAG: DUF4139 domain-containing protein [Candidatus Riflebacteria bacterium]|nr:DUF4139 domain-containing protein [Candidatus Riflebacteria bacterium]
MPEVARTAFLRTEQTNGGAVPILAGPVDLIRDSGYVGRTTVLYVAPGERFELGWGPDPEVRLNRFDDRTVEEPGLLGAWTTIDHRIKIWLSHLGAEPRKLKVRERVPVSEVEKVKVEFDGAHTSPGTVTPDQNGFVTWELGLKPRSRQQLELRYVLKRHKDVTGV